MSTPSPTTTVPESAGRALARARWDSEAGVDARLDALAGLIRRRVDALPPLTEAQRARLAALLRPTEVGSR